MLLSSARGAPSPNRAHTPPSRPGTAGSQRGPAWVPPGVRPHSPPRNTMHPMTGTRRNKAVEHMHLFIDSPELPPDDPANFFWLYGAFDYKMQCPFEQAKQTVVRTINRLVDRMNSRYAPQAAGGPQQQTIYGGGPNPPVAPPSLKTAQQHQEEADHGAGATVAPTPLKAHLIFDIISTKKHLGAVPTQGLPYQLGLLIYEYVEKNHNAQIVTTFVGLTDNTARRVGRDIYYTQSDALSKSRMPFSAIDKQHMFVIFPPDQDDPPPGRVDGAAPTSSTARARGSPPLLSRNASPYRSGTGAASSSTTTRNTKTNAGIANRAPSAGRRAVGGPPNRR